MKTKKRDQVDPKPKWEFDAKVTDAFDDMLERSIPQYAVMRDTVTRLARHFATPDTDILDIGCSRGEVLHRLRDLAGHCTLYGVETSRPMLDACTHRFRKEIRKGFVKILDADITKGLPPVRASVVTAILTLQFTPIEYRPHILADVHQRLAPGGVLILVEKVIGHTALLDRTFVEEYYSLKARNGYSQEQIERKRLSLQGVLVPVTAAMNEDFIRSAGFEQVDCCWRWLNFAGWIAVKRQP